MQKHTLQTLQSEILEFHQSDVLSGRLAVELQVVIVERQRIVVFQRLRVNVDALDVEDPTALLSAIELHPPSLFFKETALLLDGYR